MHASMLYMDIGVRYNQMITEYICIQYAICSVSKCCEKGQNEMMNSNGILTTDTYVYKLRADFAFDYDL